jgi:tight adherence protein C
MDALVIWILAFLTVLGIGGAIVLAPPAVRREKVKHRLREGDPEAEHAQALRNKPLMLRVLDYTGRLVSSKKLSGLQKELAQAGYHGTDAPSLFLGAKVLLFVMGLAGLGIVLLPSAVALQISVLLIVGSAAGLSFLPNVVVHVRRAQRAKEVRRHLPDVLDLLEICVSSGIGMEMAWNSVADHIRTTTATLADEMALTDLEMHLGASRGVAMRHMSERTGSEDLSALVATLAQSERFGTSLSDALRVFAASMREARSLRAAEAAEKLAVKLLFPMIVFIFPALLIVTVGPAGQTLVDLFSHD